MVDHGIYILFRLLSSGILGNTETKIRLMMMELQHEENRSICQLRTLDFWHTVCSESPHLSAPLEDAQLFEFQSFKEELSLWYI